MLGLGDERIELILVLLWLLLVAPHIVLQLQLLDLLLGQLLPVRARRRARRHAGQFMQIVQPFLHRVMHPPLDRLGASDLLNRLVINRRSFASAARAEVWLASSPWSCQ